MTYKIFCDIRYIIGSFLVIISIFSLYLVNIKSFLINDKTFHYNFNKAVLDKSRILDLEGDDIIVFLHIQKTGGSTFGRHLVKNLVVEPPCEWTPNKKACHCVTKNNRLWLFSRYSIGWRCGLHADWTELHDCVEEWFEENDVRSRKIRRLVVEGE